ncbi:vWA domain-containing protein [Brevifollis gellanilyticus]|uniref:Aerotolerance regulator N-terminal domain-containing protein n=1 Tax=Brevifollis gellanilyticus TaxID=748831 RepID=A0A512M1X2_9BACT|nr:BatA and WFA domain-containing protein [Brevifollis gellanilyticus]GEP40747.1 hypothetical protein BGE01nite_00380 [Brevifollis gellanilyticus]
MLLAHPAALWCLLGLPVVLAIHFLQRRSRKEVVTTLFLLQQMRRESETGNRFERLRPSIPLWLQLMMVLVLTWLLAGPRWLKSDAVQRIALVMDSSASMSAFRKDTETAVRDTLETLLSPLARVELTLLSSDPEEPALYHGASAADLKAAISKWQPLLGVHDFTPALRTARGLVGAEGSVILISDHVLADQLPYEAAVVSTGHETPNVGWAGITVEEKDGQLFWRALLRNYSASPQDREWLAISGGKTSAPTKVTLAAQETRTLSGPFPTEDELTLQLTADAFTLDDTLPVLRPKPKILGLQVPALPVQDGSVELRDLFGKFSDTRLVMSSDEADVRGLVWPPSTALGQDQHAVVFASPAKGDKVAWLRDSIVAESHPLIDGLNWQSLLVREGMIVPRDQRDRVLLWQGERPLISLRRTPLGAQQLICHFDLLSSNARKLPALAVLLHRFLQSVRDEKIAPESANFDLRQRLVLAHLSDAKAAPLVLATRSPASQISVPVAQAHLLRAPAHPGFLEVKQADTLLLTGAAHFADAREADLSGAKPFQDLSKLKVTQVETTMESDPHSSLWILVLLAALLGSWWWTRSNAPVPKVQSA